MEEKGKKLNEETVTTVKKIVLIFIVLVTLAFSLFVGYRLYLTFWDLPQEIEVPALIGEDASVADDLLKEKGLSIRIIDSRYQEKYPSNTIIKQEPPSGIMVRKGREILVVVSLGPEMMEVPDLKGQSIRESKVLLGSNKLTIGKVQRVKDKLAEPGEVLNQVPPPGTKLKAGTKVDLTVNKGEEPMIKVPSIIGTSIIDIERKLKPSTLNLGTVTWVWHDYIPKGEIIRQTPNANSLCQPRSTVDIKVSAGRKGLELNLKQKRIIIFAPKGEGLQTVKIRQLDNLGDQTVYEGRHAPGDKIDLTLHCWGTGEIQIYNNTQLVKRLGF